MRAVPGDEICLTKLFHEAPDVGWVELPVAVDEREHASVGGAKPIADGRRVAALAIVAHHPQMSRVVSECRRCDLGGAVGAAVVDEHDLVRGCRGREHIARGGHDAADIP